MHKVVMSIRNQTLIFHSINQDSMDIPLNCIDQCNFIDYQFSESYMLSNKELISDFLKNIILRYHITELNIENLEIADSILTVVNMIPDIKKIIFSSNDTLDYSICFQLLDNSNLEYIECYNLPDIMYHRFPEGVLRTRCELLFISNFMKNNDIKTYSDLCSKKVIKILSHLTVDDIDDLDYLFLENKNLKIIKLFSYQKSDLIMILDLLKKNDVHSVSIWIYESDTNTKMILEDIELFREFKEEYDIHIIVKYSRAYRLKNRMKQLNITLLKTIVVIVIFTSIITAGILYYHQEKDYKNQEKNKDIIQNVVDHSLNEVGIVELDPISTEEEHPINPYQSTYENQMLKLLEINPDTIGWLKVSNTDIDYPVVQTTDNSYYLNYAFDKTANHAGWIYADYRNHLDKTDKNIIIYGHRVKNTNLMFTTLKNVLEEEWYQNPDNLLITFNMKEELITWKIFSIYTIEKTNDYIQTNFKMNDDFLNFIHMIQNRSVVDFQEEVLESDQILTLSTCYLDSNHRLVVHAKRIRSF